MLERKNFLWAMIACAFFVIGCFGSATMMPLFRLGAFYPIEGHNEFPSVVQSVLDKKLFALTLYPAGLCFPVSLMIFGLGFLRYNTINRIAAFSLMLCSLLYWMGNAMAMDPALIIGDALLLVTSCYLGYYIFSTTKHLSPLRNANRGFSRV
jgi:hypothetical protein